MPFHTRTQEPYVFLLERDEWKAKKEQILIRDGYRRTNCGRSNYNVDLQVHHRYYIEGRDPWEYDDSILITLCEDCHSDLHEKEGITYYVEQNGHLNIILNALVSVVMERVISPNIGTSTMAFVSAAGGKETKNLFMLLKITRSITTFLTSLTTMSTIILKQGRIY